MKGVAAHGTLEHYFAATRRLSVAVCFVAPLIVLHALAVARSDRVVEVGAERLVHHALRLGPIGERVLQAALALVVAGAIVAVVRDRVPVLRLYPAFLVECALLAAVLGPLVCLVTRTPLFEVHPTVSFAAAWPAVIGAIGAGIYEEIVFRLVGLAGLALLLRVLGFSRLGSAALATCASAAAFAWAHHVGAHGEPFAWRPFGFRLAAGLLLGAAFVLRGFAVAVYLHAAYDALFTWRVAMAPE